MTRITHQYLASCSPAQIWAVLSDLTAVPAYNPTVKTARRIGQSGNGLGAMRECDLNPKGKVSERVTLWEEGRALGLEIVESDWPVSSMSWVTRIEPHGNGARVSQTLDYSMKFGPLGWVLNALVMRRAVTKNVGIALQGMIALAGKTL